jgi:hypothetical protein
MKPVSRTTMHSSNLLKTNYNVEFGSDNTPRKISGSVQKKSATYIDATVVIFRKSDFQLIAVRKPDSDGNYTMNGLNKDVVCFIYGFDLNKQYNAVIQDNVVPK